MLKKHNNKMIINFTEMQTIIKAINYKNLKDSYK